MSDPDGQAANAELVSERFDMTGIASVRHQVAHCAESNGLDAESLDDFVLAVNELVTNAVRHGGGHGWLRLWRDGRRLVCEVSDQGGGITDGASNGHDKPAPHVAGGWGMWLARELSETMTVTTGPGGTTIRISTIVPDGISPPRVDI